MIAVLSALACVAFLPETQAVVPAPDGGYPGGNTAEGTSALLSRTTGLYNSAFGIYSLLSLTDGNFCTGVGAGTLLVNTADSNTATSAGALLSTTIGGSNTADGTFALFSNTATGNTAIGASALLSNTTGGTLGNIQGLDVGPNVAVGWQALESNTVASANTAVGYQALHSFTTGPVGFDQLGLCTAVGFQALANNAANGFGNSGFGYQALMNNTDGVGNTAIGLRALFSNTGSGNTGNGASALSSNTTGGNNTATGTSALFSNIDGDRNTADGNGALTSNTTGDDNTATGSGALFINGAGSGNTAIGEAALVNNITGNGNVAVGQDAGAQATGDGNVYIGTGMVGVAGESNACYIASIFSQTSSGGAQVLINSNNKLGTVTSSKRFKEKIEPMNQTSEALFALRPVTFYYRKEIDPAGISQLGLVAEDVEKVNPDLVVRDKEGKAYSVRYDQVNAMLLNEFLKEHKKVEAQQATITDLKSAASKQEATIVQQQKEFRAATARQENEIRELTASVREQAAQIQKVSAQIEICQSVARTALSDQ